MNTPTPKNKTLFADRIFISQTTADGLLVWSAWKVHLVLGRIDPALFDAVLADTEKHGVAKLINSDNTRSLR